MAFSTDKTRQGAAGVSTGYTIDQSLRFNDDDSAYLSWTPSSAGNQRTYTWSGWVKRGELGSQNTFFGAGASGSMFDELCFSSADQLDWYTYQSATQGQRKSTAVFRDTSAWYHIVAVYDSTDSTALDRMKLYVNGEQITDLATTTNPDQNHQGNTNGAIIHAVGAVYAGSLYNPYDGYLAEVHFIDGTAYDADDFGEEGDYGEWKPKKVSGLTYGTNGFYLDFSDSAALGDDAAGSNDWTVNNLTAVDQMLDSPTNNFATMNPNDIHDNFNLSEGNLKIYNGDSGTWASARGTFSPTSGKWYFELVIPAIWNYGHVGLLQNTYRISQTDAYENAGSWTYQFDGRTHTNNVETNASLPTLNSGDIVQTAYDVDAGKLWWGVNNTWLLSGDPAAGSNEVYSGITGDVSPHILMYSSPTTGVVMNFGADSSFAGEKTAQGNGDYDFYYTPPSGFKALCTANLDTPAVIPSEHFNTILFDDGAGAKTGVGFQPDFVWLKSRGSTYEHKLTDAVRGVTKTIASNSASTEATDSTGLTAFGADTDYSDTGGGGYYGSVAGMVAYNWKANGSGSSNEEGSINTTSTSANTDAGFSISTYTGNDVDGATVGHGLNQTPDFAFVKNRDGGDSGSAGGWWLIRHVGKAAVSSVSDGQGYGFADGIFGSGQSNFNNHGIITFNSTLATLNDGDYGSVEDWWTNQSSTDYVLYCWHSVDGYSKFGSYTGNGSADGTFVYTGFKPAFVMCRRTNASLMSWRFMDTARYTYNNSSIAGVMQWNTNAQEYNVLNDDLQLDICANGFKHRHTYSQANASGEPYIYVAFAETPFKYSNAR